MAESLLHYQNQKKPAMMRFAANCLFVILSPFFALQFAWKALRNPLYRPKASERIAWFHTPKMTSCLWVHAVSLGESIAAAPLITRLQQHWPNELILVTTMTPTGYAWLKKHFKYNITHAYLPYDYPWLMKRFFNHFNPSLGIIMETELWPNLLHIAQQKNIPIVLANGRLSNKSFNRYMKIKPLTTSMLNQLTHALIQSPVIAERFEKLGLPNEKITITGNLKFHANLPEGFAKKQSLLNTFLNQQPNWVAASTHPGEEAIILKAHRLVQKQYPQCKLILVPRHPERLPEIEALLQEHQFTYQCFTQRNTSLKEDVLVIDTIGELLTCFACTNAAFVGGSLIPRGGHNLIEPILFHLPTATGPHTFNFTDIYELLTYHQLCTTITDDTSLSTFILKCLTQSDDTLKQKCQDLIETQKGALDEHIRIITRVKREQGRTD